MWKRLLHDKGGATAVEYGLIAVLAVIGLIAAMTQIGDHTRNNFSLAGNSMNANP